MPRRKPPQIEEVAELWELFQQSPTAANYLSWRRALPDVNVVPSPIAWLDVLFSLDKELEREGISSLDFAGVLDGDDRSLDAVSLEILNALVKLRGESGKKSHVQSRGLAVKLSLIDYLIAIMTECMASSGAVPPFSFFVVICERFKIYKSSRHKKFLDKERRTNTALLVAQLYPTDPVPIRKTAKALRLDPGTLSRWLSDKEFRAKLDMFRKPLKERSASGTPGHLFVLKRM